MKSIRCSKLDDAFACPASVLGNSNVRIGGSGPEAAMGKAVHQMMADLIQDGKYDIAAVCSDHGVADTELASELAQAGEKSWREVSKYFPAPMTERSVSAKLNEEWELTGTIDVLSPVGTTNAVFVDWKTGIIDSGYHHQMAGYAYNLWQAMGMPSETIISGIVVFLRHGYYRVVKWDAAKLRAWHHDLTRNVLAAPNTYQPHAYCHQCDFYYSCQARKQMVEGTLDAMLFGGSAGPGTQFAQWLASAKALMSNLTVANKSDPVVMDTIVKLTTRVKMAEEACLDVRKMIREAVERVGPIKVSETSAVVLREMERKTLRPDIALPVLREMMPEADISKCMTLSLPSVLSTVSSGKPTAAKGAAKGMAQKKLEDAGAIERTTFLKMEEVDISTLNPTEFQHGNPISQHAHHGVENQGAGSGTGAGGSKRKKRGGGGTGEADVGNPVETDIKP